MLWLGGVGMSNGLIGRFRIPWGILAAQFSRTVRLLFHPRTIQTVKIFINLGHTASALLWLGSRSLFLVGLVLCGICFALQSAALTRTMLLLRNGILLAANLLAATYINFVDNLTVTASQWFPGIRALWVVIAIGFVLTAFDWLADELHRTYHRRELFSPRSEFVTDFAYFSFELGAPALVRVKVMADGGSLDPISFTARIVDSNNALVYQLSRSGRLAVSEKPITLPGLYYIAVRNTSRPKQTIRVVCSASISTWQGETASRRDSEQPLEISSLLRANIEPNADPAKQYALSICPTVARAANPPDNLAECDNQTAQPNLESAPLCESSGSEIVS